jgi:hypothetical protein
MMLVTVRVTLLLSLLYWYPLRPPVPLPGKGRCSYPLSRFSRRIATIRPMRIRILRLRTFASSCIPTWHTARSRSSISAIV